MTSTLSFNDIIAQYLQQCSIIQYDSNKTLRFLPMTALFYQRQIVALWRECNRLNLHPTAKTLLGKIIAINLHP